MTDVLLAAALAAIGPAYLVGRWVELRRWMRQRDHAYEIVAAAQRRLNETRMAEAQALVIVRQQRELLDTFCTATDTIWRRDDAEAWSQLRWASQRARTELL